IAFLVSLNGEDGTWELRLFEGGPKLLENGGVRNLDAPDWPSIELDSNSGMPLRVRAVGDAADVSEARRAEFIVEYEQGAQSLFWLDDADEVSHRLLPPNVSLIGDL